MGIDRPWIKPFQRLIVDLRSELGGTIIEPIGAEDAHTGSSANSFFRYPRFEYEMEGRSLVVEISEVPFKRTSIFEAGDNTEYLRISLRVNCQSNLAIRTESWIDRVQKAVGFAWEHQTGDESFDREFFIIADQKDRPEFLNDPDARETIQRLSPFDGFSVSGGMVIIADEVSDRDFLTLSLVKSRIAQLLRFARVIERE